MSRPESILASYATFKELYSNGQYKSPYQILAEFVNYILYTENIYSFTLSDLKRRLGEMFGFDLPIAVIKTTTKGIEYVEKTDANTYSVDLQALKANPNFKVYQENATEESIHISNLLIDFVQAEFSDQYFEKNRLIQEFVAYLLDDSIDGRYHDIISKFIIVNENNSEIQSQIQSIREGSILYAGLNYNISDIGSITKNLTLYLDTEILFSLVGYNGEIYRELAMDFFRIVQSANVGERRIHLRYFKEVKEEIESFFAAAEDIVSGKGMKRNNSAMIAITTGCSDSTDVVDRMSDFFQKLKVEFLIVEDEKNSYYSTEDYDANLEGITFGEDIPDDEESAQAVRFISNINKLRKNVKYYEYTESGYIFVTATNRVLEISKKVIESCTGETDDKKMAGYALHVDSITNILWYKLNKGFGNKNYPKNLNAVIKAKTVLSRHISQEVTRSYREMKKQYDAGMLTQDQMGARIMALRKKAEKPDELSSDNIDNNLNFDPEYINRYEDTMVAKDKLLREKELIIHEMQNRACFEKKQYEKNMLEMQSVIDSQNTKQHEQQKRIDSQQEQINQLLEEKEKKARRIKKIKKISLFTVIILLYVGIIAGSVFVIYRFCKFKKWDFATIISIVLGAIGTLSFWQVVIKRVYKKIFK